MTINCSQLDDLLYDGSALAMETAARHAQSCATCAETLASWNDLGATAQSLRTTWQSDLLLPRIQRAVAADRRRPSRRIWQIAAAVFLTVLLGGTMVQALRSQARDAAFDHDILRLSAMDEVERAEREHLHAIDRLEKVAESKLDADDSPLMAAYKEKLMLLDDAIAECEANIEQNRQNAHLRRQLLAMYSDKQQTLQDIVREGNDVSTP